VLWAPAAGTGEGLGGAAAPPPAAPTPGMAARGAESKSRQVQIFGKYMQNNLAEYLLNSKKYNID